MASDTRSISSHRNAPRLRHKKTVCSGPAPASRIPCSPCHSIGGALGNSPTPRPVATTAAALSSPSCTEAVWQTRFLASKNSSVAVWMGSRGGSFTSFIPLNTSGSIYVCPDRGCPSETQSSSSSVNSGVFSISPCSGSVHKTRSVSSRLSNSINFSSCRHNSTSSSRLCL